MVRSRFPAANASPAIAGDVVFIGVLNGTLQARDLTSGEVLWNFETELSNRTKWVLTKDRAFNDPLLYHSSWREDPLPAADQQFAIGAIFSSPLIVDGVVYFGAPTVTFMPSNNLIVRQAGAGAGADLFESKAAVDRISTGRRDARPIFSENHQPTYCHVL